MPEITVLSPSRLRTGTRTRKLSSVTGYNSDAMQSFWGIKLSEENTESEWNMREDDDEFGNDRDYMVNHLMIKTATLGAGITKSEEHLVEIETYDMNQKLLKIPVINMVAGVNAMMNMDLVFNDRHKVTFRLIAGTGPVYLSGVVIQEHPEEENSQESMYTETETTATDDNGENESEELGEEEEVEDEEEDDEVQLKGKGMKRKSYIALKSSRSKQRGKMEDEEESEEAETEDEEDEEDEEEEMDTGSKKKKKSTASPKPGKSPRGKADKKSPGLKDKKKNKKSKSK